MPTGAEILQALNAGQYRASDSPFGITSGVVANNLGSMINPYASTTENLGIAVGGGLFSALLAGLAANDARNSNAQLGILQNEFLSATPQRQAELVASEPRLQPLQQLQIQGAFDVANKIREQQALMPGQLDLEIKKNQAAAINDLYKSQGMVIGLDGKPVQIMDPVAQKVLETTAVKQAEQDVLNKGLPDSLKGVAPSLRADAAQEIQESANTTKALEFANSQFEQAKKIGSLSALFTGTTGANEMEGITNSLATFVQRYLGREMSAVERENFVKILPDWNDSVEQIELKQARFNDMIRSFAKATPITGDASQPGSTLTQALGATQAAGGEVLTRTLRNGQQVQVRPLGNGQFEVID